MMEQFCILDNENRIENMIVADKTFAAEIGALPAYDGAKIGDTYAPPAPEPEEVEPTTEEILLEIAADHEARLCEIELGVN